MLGAALIPQHGLLQENSAAGTSPEQGHQIGESQKQGMSRLQQAFESMSCDTFAESLDKYKLDAM